MVSIREMGRSKLYNIDSQISNDSLLSRFERYSSKGRAAVSKILGLGLEKRSRGSYVWLEDGRSLLNFAGYGTQLLGACHPTVVEAVQSQVSNLPLSSRIALDNQSPKAVTSIASVTPQGLSKVFMCNSGAEATEAAIKLARANGRNKLVTTTDGYHGKTMGALSVTANAFYQTPFHPLLQDVSTITYGAINEVVQTVDSETLFIVEPIQGEAGVIFPPRDYLSQVVQHCKKVGALVVFDEILTGLGRCGRMWGAAQVVPDMMLVGKSLSGGVVPVSALVTTPQLFTPFDRDPFLHTSTFGGSPIASAAVNAALRVILEERIPERAKSAGESLYSRLKPHQSEKSCIKDIRGEGCLWAIEFNTAGQAGTAFLSLVENGVLVNHSLNNSSVIRLTPSAYIQQEEIELFDRALSEALKSAERE